MLRLIESLAALAVGFPGRAFFQAQAERAGMLCGVHVLDWDAFQQDTSTLITYLTAPGGVTIDANKMAARRCVPARLSGPALQLFRSLILVDGVCRKLDPDFAWKLI